jgi:hypothetical protein
MGPRPKFNQATPSLAKASRITLGVARLRANEYDRGQSAGLCARVIEEACHEARHDRCCHDFFRDVGVRRVCPVARGARRHGQPQSFWIAPGKFASDCDSATGDASGAQPWGHRSISGLLRRLLLHRLLWRRGRSLFASGAGLRLGLRRCGARTIPGGHRQSGISA